jgi:hypothetical protein
MCRQPLRYIVSDVLLSDLSIVTEALLPHLDFLQIHVAVLDE